MDPVGCWFCALGFEFGGLFPGFLGLILVVGWFLCWEFVVIVWVWWLCFMLSCLISEFGCVL